MMRVCFTGRFLTFPGLDFLLGDDQAHRAGATTLVDGECMFALAPVQPRFRRHDRVKPCSAPRVQNQAHWLANEDCADLHQRSMKVRLLRGTCHRLDGIPHKFADMPELNHHTVTIRHVVASRRTTKLTRRATCNYERLGHDCTTKQLKAKD